MDRFIVFNSNLKIPKGKTFKIQYGQIYRNVVLLLKNFAFNLKSNMDRFIDCKHIQPLSRNFHLKSNMDRFIEKNFAKRILYLKI